MRSWGGDKRGRGEARLLVEGREGGWLMVEGRVVCLEVTYSAYFFAKPLPRVIAIQMNIYA